MPQEHVLSLRLALMGRPVKSYVFGKPVIQVGRDPEADVVIDNPGVSREHLRLELNPEGEYEVVDLGSANGTLLNDMPVKCKIPLRTGDTVRLGKYTLTVSYEQDRRASRASETQSKSEPATHTMVMSRDELHRVFERQLELEHKPAAPPPVVARAIEARAASAPGAKSYAHRVATRVGVIAAISGLLVGAAAGAAAVWYVVH